MELKKYIASAALGVGALTAGSAEAHAQTNDTTQTTELTSTPHTVPSEEPVELPLLPPHTVPPEEVVAEEPVELPLLPPHTVPPETETTATTELTSTPHTTPPETVIVEELPAPDQTVITVEDPNAVAQETTTTSLHENDAKQVDSTANTPDTQENLAGGGNNSLPLVVGGAALTGAAIGIARARRNQTSN